MHGDLIDQYRQMHRERAYGTTSVKKAPYILPYIQLLKPRTVVDYGCGQSSLAELISERCGVKATRYDPAIPAYEKRPTGRCDLLINVDVLEHVPEEAIDGVVADMAQLSDNAIIIVDTRPASTLLPDGRNAHVTLRPVQWWMERLAGHYPHVRQIWVQRRPASFITWRISRAQATLAVVQSASRKVQATAGKIAKYGLLSTLRRI